MMKRFLILFFFAVISVAFTLKAHTPIQRNSVPPFVDPVLEQQILQATVQIALFEHANDQGVAAGGDGLGTLVQHGTETFIVTHDHWSHLNLNLNKVNFWDAQGSLLLTLPADTFYSLIRYRDGGTMILTSPPGLNTLRPTTMTLATEVDSGDLVWVTRRSPADGLTTVEVVTAQVEKVVTANRPAQIHMHGTNGTILAPGDSGGGVWMQGHVVGNLWTRGVVYIPSWLANLLGRQPKSPTDSMVAALLPQSAVQ